MPVAYILDEGDLEVALHRVLRLLSRHRGPQVERAREVIETALILHGEQHLEIPLQRRLCRVCHKVYHVTEFERDPRGPEGRSFRCLFCKREKDRRVLERKRGVDRAPVR